MKKTRIAALVSLLEDEDKQVSSSAMEQLLLLDEEVDNLVRDLQESHNPIVRNRIHQLGNVLTLRRARSLFIEGVRSGAMPLWDGIMQINYQYNPRLNFAAVEKMVGELIGKLPRRPSTLAMAAFLRDEGFGYTGEDVLGADLYLVEDVLRQRVGSPVLLSALAKHLGEQCKWTSFVVLYRGKHCLLDAHYNLIEPAAKWAVTRLSPTDKNDKQYSCGNRDVWLAILSQLFLSALSEGSLQAIQRIGDILARLSGGEFQHLPYPLGS